MKGNDNKRLPLFPGLFDAVPPRQALGGFNVIEKSLIDETTDTLCHQETKKTKEEIEFVKCGRKTKTRGFVVVLLCTNFASFSLVKRASCSFPSQVYRNCTPTISSRPWDIWQGISRLTTMHCVEQRRIPISLLLLLSARGERVFRLRRSGEGSPWRRLVMHHREHDWSNPSHETNYIPLSFLIDSYFFDFLLLLFCQGVTEGWWFLCTTHLRESNQRSDGENQKYKGRSLLLFLHWFNKL